MKRGMRIALTAALLAGLLACPALADEEAPVLVLTVDGVISPVTVEYLQSGLDLAEELGATCLVMELDTPGGLLESARQAVRLIMNAEVPVVTYVAPRGARAGSAGVFLTLAAHVAAMAPATHIGAAHPVQLPSGIPGEKNLCAEVAGEAAPGETKISEGDDASESLGKLVTPASQDTMMDKILNDTVAWVRSIARSRGRNEEWAVKSVVESDSIPSEEALELGVVDLVAEDLTDLLARIDGREVEVASGPTTIASAAARVVRHEMTARQEFLALITHPEIIALLLAIGGLGIIVELTHPGMIFPGVMGVLSLIVGLYAVQVLPVEIAGVLLILVGFVLLLMELKVPSYGLLTVGGITSLVVGALMLVDDSRVWMEVPMMLIITIAGGAGLVTAGLLWLILRTHRGKVVTGQEGMIGAIGQARTDLDPGGLVFVQGMIWRARSQEPIPAGSEVEVLGIRGLALTVRPARGARGAGGEA